MIVCLCRAVSDHALRAAAVGRSLDEVVRDTGVGSDCGCCAEEVARIVSAPCREEPCAGCPRRTGAAGAARAAA
ncbi:MAG TPA: (2Fe-2S)-binding protein [Anaeromyxobacteraceae bacterium]|jgi:bacterioferritin-associated ferredoxin